MEAFLGLAFKSLVVAGAGLALLALLKKRSPAERSWIAHMTLLALLLLPVAPWVLPSLHVQGPQFLSSMGSPAEPETVQPVAATGTPKALPTFASPSPAETKVAVEPQPSLLSNVNWTQLAYWTPAAVLFLMTLLAVARLVALRARAEVLVDAHWLSALARAQRRMGFKHGTALLISDELSSPISWGLVRPVILLNTRAVEAANEAEAIIAHELAHVARLDWVKLLLARVVTAVFWFNPLVWVLAREAHQLREEAADDAVLGADIPDTDYAELLVGVARHECRGLLIGAHGVAPSKGSLARRVARVLDSGLARGPAARSFAAGVFVGAAALAAPLAAITLSPESSKSEASEEAQSRYYPQADVASGANGSTAIAGASAATLAQLNGWSEAERRAFEKNVEASVHAAWDGRGPKPGTVGPQGVIGPKSPIDLAIEMKAVGASPEYLRSIRAEAPNLGEIDADDLVALAATGVSPAYIRDLASSGYRNLTADDIMSARALGITGNYIRGIRSASGQNFSMEDLVSMKAVGVTPADVQRLNRMGHGRASAEQIVSFKAVGGFDEDPDVDVDVNVDPHDDDDDDGS